MLQYIGKWRKFISVNDLCVMFPDINFSNDDNDYSGDPANESLHSTINGQKNSFC